MRILVIGATGMLGQPVVRRLLADGYVVRLLSRVPAAAQRIFGEDCEVVAGDVTQRDSLAPAMTGCDVVYVNLRGGNTIASFDSIERVGAANIAAAAASSGVGRLGYISGAGIGESAIHSPLLAIKAAAIAAIIASGVEYTIFKPTHFMESLPQFIHGQRAVVIGHQPHRYHYLAADDYADLVSRSFRLKVAANQSLTVFGPGAFTMAEALQMYCDAVHPGMRVGSMPVSLARLVGWLTRNPDLRFAAGLFEDFSRFGERGDPTVTVQLLGQPPTTLHQWCRERATH